MKNVIDSNDVVKTALTEIETVEAEKHEKIVEEGLAGYVAIGEALGTIRDQHLFVGPFKEYVEQRFEIDYPTANRRIVAARVALNLKAANLTIPANQDQAYKLHELTTEKQIETWQKVVEQAKTDGVRITTNLIRVVMGEKPQSRMSKKGETPGPITQKPKSPTPTSNGTPEAPVNTTSETVEKATPAPKPEPQSVPSREKLNHPVVAILQAVGKAVTNLQVAYREVENAEMAGGEIEHLQAMLSEITDLVNDIRDRLPTNAQEEVILAA